MHRYGVSHTKLYKGAWNVSSNNSETVGHKDLKRGQIVYILVFYNISFSWFLPLDGFQFNFLLRDSENVLLLWEHFKVVVTYMSTLTTLLRKPSFDSHVFQDLLFSYKKRFISIFHVLNYSIIFSQIYYRLFIEWFEKIWEEKTWILKNDQMADAWFNILWC